MREQTQANGGNSPLPVDHPFGTCPRCERPTEMVDGMLTCRVCYEPAGEPEDEGTCPDCGVLTPCVEVREMLRGK